MDLEVSPEPDGQVRAALEAALAARRAEDTRAAGETPWWRAGIEESVRDDLRRE